MNYLDIETIQLFLYLLYYTPELKHENRPKMLNDEELPPKVRYTRRKDREFHNLLDVEQFPEKLKSFKEKVKDDIFSNKVEDAFFIAKSNPLLKDDIFTKKTEEVLKIIKHDAKLGDNFWIILENPDKLMTFLAEYTNRLRHDELTGNPNIFKFKTQLEYLQKEFDYLSKHYGDKFTVTPVFRDETNFKEANACGLRIFDFIMFLHFHQNFYISIKDCKRIQPNDNYLYLKDKFFNIALEVELAKPVKQIFDELNQELMKEQEQALKETKGIIIAGYTVEKIDKKGSFDHGKYRLTYKNNVREGLIHSKRKADVLIYLLKKIGSNISIEDIFSEFVFEGKVPFDTLETYLGELNTALRAIFKPKGRKKYLEIANNIIINRIP